MPDALLGGMVARPTRRITDYDACGGFVKAREQVRQTGALILLNPYKFS